MQGSDRVAKLIQWARLSLQAQDEPPYIQERLQACVVIGQARAGWLTELAGAFDSVWWAESVSELTVRTARVERVDLIILTRTTPALPQLQQLAPIIERDRPTVAVRWGRDRVFGDLWLEAHEYRFSDRVAGLRVYTLAA